MCVIGVHLINELLGQYTGETEGMLGEERQSIDINYLREKVLLRVGYETRQGRW